MNSNLVCLDRKWGRPEPAPTPAPSRFEPAPVRPRLEVEFLRPAKVIDYNHKRLEPGKFTFSNVS